MKKIEEFLKKTGPYWVCFGFAILNLINLIQLAIKYDYVAFNHYSRTALITHLVFLGTLIAVAIIIPISMMIHKNTRSCMVGYTGIFNVFVILRVVDFSFYIRIMDGNHNKETVLPAALYLTFILLAFIGINALLFVRNIKLQTRKLIMVTLILISMLYFAASCNLENFIQFGDAFSAMAVVVFAAGVIFLTPDDANGSFIEHVEEMFGIKKRTPNYDTYYSANDSAEYDD